MEYRCTVSTDDFNVFCLDGDKVGASIKEEQVSMVQGRRSRRLLLRAGGGDWNEELEGFGDTAPRNVQSRVTKMKCSAHKALFKDHTSSFEMGKRSERMLTMFCWRLNIPHVFGLGSEARSRATGDSSSTSKKNKSSKEKSSTGKSGSTPSNPVSSKSRRLKRGMGGAGSGGKPPPKKPRRDSLPDSDISLPTEEETTSLEPSDTSDALTLTETSDAAVSLADTPKLEGLQNASDKPVPKLEGKLQKGSDTPKLEGKLQKGSDKSVPNKEKPVKTRSPAVSSSHWEREAITKLALAKTKMLVDSPAQVAALGKLLAYEGNDEWLGWTSSEDQNVDEDRSEKPVADEDSSSKEGPKAERHLQQFLVSTKLLYGISSALGLTPYVRQIEENGRVHVKWNLKSSRYYLFYLNAILFLLVTLGTLSTLLVVVGISEESTISAAEEILQFDYANHVGECLFLTFITMFLSIWAVSCIMELGPHYSEFMTRFYLGIYLIKYDVTDEIDSMIRRTLLTTAAFLSAIVALFFGGRTKTAAVRESCGFVGLSVLRPFNSDLRESIYFPLVEIFGLFVSLHVFLSFIVVLLEFVVYAKALENMAERFNLRLVYRLGMVAKRSLDGSVVVMKKYIPYSKLEAEHRVIMSLFHHLGQVSGIVHGGYLFTTGLQVMLVMWMLLQAFTPSEISGSSRYVRRVGSVELAVPLRVGESYAEILVEVALILLFTFAGFLTFGGVMHKAAEMLQTGSEYVRRFGFLRCRCKKDVRFLLTMINSYTNKYPFWIGKVFHWNRMGMVAFLGFMIAASMVFASFHPSRSEVVHFLECNEQGSCTIFNIRRGELRVLYAAKEVSVPLEPSALFQTTHEPRATTAKRDRDAPRLLHIEPEFRLAPPCSTPGEYPYGETVHTSLCDSRWPRAPTFPSTLYTPFLYKPIEEKDRAGTTQKYVGGVVQQFANVPPRSSQCNSLSSTLEGASTINRLKVSSCISSKFTCFSFPFAGAFHRPSSGNVVDCFGATISDNYRDDCGNLKLATPNDVGERIEPKLRLVDTRDLPRVRSQPSLLCCYEYRGYPESEKQAQVCNMPDAATVDIVCQFGAERSRMVGRVQQVHDELLEVIEYEKEKGGSDADFLAKNQDVFSECLCQLGPSPSGDGGPEVEQCENRLVIPCQPGRPTRVKYYALKCEPNSPTGASVYIPLLFKANSALSIRDPVEHQRFKNHCTGARFTDSLDHDNRLDYPNPDGGTTQLEDCATHKLTLGGRDKDDCENWRISTPDSKGVMTSPQVRLLQFDYHNKTIVERASEMKIFLCCFHYASPPFQRNSEQLRFCNAPSAIAMNSEAFCGNAVKRRTTAPPLPSVVSSPPRLHEQLNEKLQFVTSLFKKKNGGELLHDVGRHDKWRKCLCPNLIQPFGQSDYDKSVEECKAMIPTPCELDAAGFGEAYSNCQGHNWGANFPSKFIRIPRVFTRVNGILEVVAQFRNPATGEVSRCQLGNFWQLLFDSDDYDMPPLFDCFGEQFPLVRDECRNLRLPFLTRPNLNRVLPKLHPSAEFLLGKYDPSFKSSSAVHCCYSYRQEEMEEWRVCYKQDGKFIKADCDLFENSDRRKRHEKELVRRLRVETEGAEFIGDKVALILSPSTLAWNTPQEEAWTRCICEERTTPEATHAMCEQKYLPPCIKPKNTPVNYLDGPMMTQCISTWPPTDKLTIPKFIYIPIAMEQDYRDKSFQVVKRFNGRDCPTEATDKDIILHLGLGEIRRFTDCYGQSFPGPVPKDECGNPRIASPDSSGERKFPVKRLIPQNLIPGGQLVNSKDFFCCYEYANSTVAVNVCNKLNFDNFIRVCALDGRSGQQKRFSASLKEGHVSSDVFAESFSDPHRLLWTNCICEGECPDAIEKEVEKAKEAANQNGGG